MTDFQHVIDSIDHALDDCSVSGDAMRWAPDEPLPEWERALVADPFDPDHPALRPGYTRGLFQHDRQRPFARVHLNEWAEVSDAAEPDPLPGYAQGGVYQGYARNWAARRQAALDGPLCTHGVTRDGRIVPVRDLIRQRRPCSTGEPPIHQ